MALSTGRSFGCTSSRKPSLPTGAFVMSIRPETSLGHHAHAEDHQVDRYLQLRPEGERVADLHPQRVGVRGVRELHRGSRLVVEAQEEDAALGGVHVVGLLVLLVGPDVAVQVYDRRLRVPGADLVGRLEGGRAADARAVLVELAARAGLVDALDLAAADAVDERDRPRHAALDLQLAAGGALRVQHPVELGQRHDARATGRSRTRPGRARSGRSRSRPRSRRPRCPSRWARSSRSIPRPPTALTQASQRVQAAQSMAGRFGTLSG